MPAPISGLDADPWINCVQKGIVEDLQLVLAHKRWRAAMTLTYAGIDAMAYTTVPEGQKQVRSHFVAWAERYIRFPGTDQIAGLDLYGARCAVLHSYGTESDLSREGKCRLVIHVVGGAFPVWATPDQPDAVAVEIGALARAFLVGTERYGDEVSRDEERWKGVEARLLEFNQSIPNK